MAEKEINIHPDLEKRLLDDLGPDVLEKIKRAFRYGKPSLTPYDSLDDAVAKGALTPEAKKRIDELFAPEKLGEGCCK